MRSSKNKLFLTIFLSILFLFSVMSFAAQKKTSTSIEGVYSNFVSSSETGDIEGFRIIIINSGDAYFVVAQYAEGGLPEPVLVKATVKDRLIKFKLPDGNFEGEITNKGLNLTVSFSNAHKNKPILVKRLLGL